MRIIRLVKLDLRLNWYSGHAVSFGLPLNEKTANGDYGQMLCE